MFSGYAYKCVCVCVFLSFWKLFSPLTRPGLIYMLMLWLLCARLLAFHTALLFCSQLLQHADELWVHHILDLRICGSASMHRCSHYTGQSKEIMQYHHRGSGHWTTECLGLERSLKPSQFQPLPWAGYHPYIIDSLRLEEIDHTAFMTVSDTLKQVEWALTYKWVSSLPPCSYQERAKHFLPLILLRLFAFSQKAKSRIICSEKQRFLDVVERRNILGLVRCMPDLMFYRRNYATVYQ